MPTCRFLSSVIVFVLLVLILEPTNAVSRVVTFGIESLCGKTIRPGGYIEALHLIKANKSSQIHSCKITLSDNFPSVDQKLHYFLREFRYKDCSQSIGWQRKWLYLYVTDSSNNFVFSFTDCAYNRSALTSRKYRGWHGHTYPQAININSPLSLTAFDLVITRADSIPAGRSCQHTSYQVCPLRTSCVHKELFCNGLINCPPSTAQATDETNCSTVDPPATWCAWGAWSTCNAQDASVCRSSAQQARTRQCCPRSKGHSCPGNNVQYRPCSEAAVCCLQWCAWGTWSTCTSCASRRTRHRYCMCRPDNCTLMSPGSSGACGSDQGDRTEMNTCSKSAACIQEKETWRYLAVVGGACASSLLLFIIPFAFYARRCRRRHPQRRSPSTPVANVSDRLPQVTPYVPPAPGRAPFNFEVSVIGQDNAAFDTCDPLPPTYDAVMDNKEVYGVTEESQSQPVPSAPPHQSL